MVTEKHTGGLIDKPILLALDNTDVAFKAMMRKFILEDVVHNIEKRMEEDWDTEFLGKETTH